MLEEFLKPSEITQSDFAKHIGVTAARLSEIVKGKRRVTVDTAQRLSMALGTTPEYWLDLQRDYDLATTPKPKKIRSLL